MLDPASNGETVVETKIEGATVVGGIGVKGEGGASEGENAVETEAEGAPIIIGIGVEGEGDVVDGKLLVPVGKEDSVREVGMSDGETETVEANEELHATGTGCIEHP